jgi:carbohydrate diacid regulator
LLTASLAQEIAQENAAVTGLGILITDRNGDVIGSSDPKRVGSFHEASIEVIQTGMPASHTARQAAALQGVRPGLTLPILLDGTAVGTVGITGSPQRVRRFGPLVRRHTEILLREAASLRSQLLRESGIEDLVRDIAGFDPALIEPAFLHARAAELGFTLECPRAAVMFHLSADPGELRTLRQDALGLRAELIRIIRERFAHPQDIVAATGPGRFVVLHRLSNSRHFEAALATVCDAVAETVHVRYKLTVHAAIGGAAVSLIELRSGLQDASDALVLGRRIAPRATTHSIHELRPYQLLSNVGQRYRTRLVATELAELRGQSDWRQLRATLIAWSEARFKLVDAAAALHIHRNTLLYRLAKIEQLTGRSLRDHTASVTMYLACLADQIDDD